MNNNRFLKILSILILLIIIVILVIYNGNNYNIKYKENFDRSGTEFIPLGIQRYDLRGEPLKTRPIYDCRYDCFGDCYNSNI